MSTVCYISLIICVCAHPLHSCSIEVAVTIEPSEDNSGNASDEEASPKKPLRAVQVVNGYLLRDPHEKNRLSVWFTGGKLAPYSPPDSAESLDDDTSMATLRNGRLSLIVSTRLRGASLLRIWAQFCSWGQNCLKE
jgi:hypothetical protein